MIGITSHNYNLSHERHALSSRILEDLKAGAISPLADERNVELRYGDGSSGSGWPAFRRALRGYAALHGCLVVVDDERQWLVECAEITGIFDPDGATSFLQETAAAYGERLGKEMEPESPAATALLTLYKMPRADYADTPWDIFWERGEYIAETKISIPAKTHFHSATDLRLSPDGLARLKEVHPFNGEPELMALYDIARLTQPVAVYTYDLSDPSEGPGLRHAWRDDLLAVCVRPDGRISGHESGPVGPGFEESMLQLADAQDTADGLAILVAIAEYWDFRDASEACAKDWGRGRNDVSSNDFQEGKLLMELRCRFAEAIVRGAADQQACPFYKLQQ
ncbi:hypothetical protein [Mesorhizobium sp. 1B3]|uniref:hypothetical protein n=1 Tax=Mesorhizobium sp. 1B3 TaxID=3243599 RepID=UPI003D96386B